MDSCRFFDEYYSRDTILERPDLGQGGSLPVVDLLIQQVECADLVVLNKSDLMERDGGGESAMGRLQECVHTLNPLAKILVATRASAESVAAVQPAVLLQEEGRRLFAPGDPISETKLWISRARPECYSFVTTDLDVKTAKERLSGALPSIPYVAVSSTSCCTRPHPGSGRTEIALALSWHHISFVLEGIQESAAPARI